MGDENPVCTLGDYSKPSHEGYRNTFELPEGNNVVPLRSETIRLVQNGCSFHGLRSKDPNQHLKDFLKLVDSLDLDVSNRKRTRLRLFQFSLRDQASNWLERESFSEAWTHFKDLLQKVPHHGIDLWLQVQISYDHVNPATRQTIDQSAGVAYKLDLPEELDGVHDTFHALNLKKCLADLTLQVTLDEIQVCRLVPSCFVIFDLEPLSLSFDFVFTSEIFKSLSFSLDRLCHLAILCLDQHAHTLHHLESLLTISLDRLDILKEDLFEHEHVVINPTSAGMRHLHIHLYMNLEIKQLAVKRVDEYGFIQRISLTGFPAQSVGSSNTDVLDLPCLLVLITGTSQSRQHDKSESDSYYLSD
ncbi:hypothetical protein Tco_0684416 [Tanacetum coccineum]